MRKIVGLLGSIGGLGLFVLNHAVETSNFLGLFQLPEDVKAALIVFADVPSLVTWAAFALGLLCAGYLVVEFRPPFPRMGRN